MEIRILVDGQNLLRHGDGSIKIDNLRILRLWAEENEVVLLIILPSFREYRENITPDSDILYTNSYVYDDSVLIQLAISHNLPIMSNDRFREYRKIYPEYDFNTRVFSFDVILGILVSELTDYCRIINHTSNEESTLHSETFYPA